MPFDITAVIDMWRGQLLDTSKRNRLISFNTGRSGGIKLIYPDPDDIWHTLIASDLSLTFPWRRDLLGEPIEPTGQEALRLLTDLDAEDGQDAAPGGDVLARCRDSPRLQADHVLTDLDDKQLARRLGRLALAAKTSLNEQGVATLHLAFGFLRWYESADSEVELTSPLLLVSARLERESVEAPWRLSLEDNEVAPNHSLAQLLASSTALQLPSLPEDKNPEDHGWRKEYFAGVQQVVQHHRRWEVLDEVALGVFGFQRVAMWNDLGANRDLIAAHDLCRAIAGDASVRLPRPAGIPASRELDRIVRPRETFHILDSDSSQHEAIEAAKAGASLVLDGPPGTGKSQTIANLIAESLTRGKTILFVSEKAAALEVVKRRLDAHRLGDFCLECHSHKANKKLVIDELGRCLGLEGERYQDRGEALDRLHDARTRLNDYVRSLHEVRQPLGLSAFQVHGRLAAISAARATRCPVPDVMQFDAARLRTMTELLVALKDCRGAIEDRGKHPWRGCRAGVGSLMLREDAQHHFGRLAAALAEIAATAPALERLGFLPEAPTRSAWLDGLDVAAQACDSPTVPADWFSSDPRAIASAFVELDRTACEYQRIREGVPEFASGAIWGLDAVGLDAVRTFRCTGTGRLRPHGKPTLRAYHAHLGSVVQQLSELGRRAAATRDAGRRVAALLRVPSGAPPRAVADACVELDRLAREYRRVREALPEFAKDALKDLDPASLDAFARQGGGALALLRPHSRKTIVGLRDHLRTVVGRVRDLQGLLTAISEGLERALTRLGLPARPVAVGGVGRLADLLGIVAGLGEVRRPWLDAAQRPEIQRVVERCIEDARQAGQTRLGLLERLVPMAFDLQYAPLAANWRRFDSLWKRLQPSWWSYRTRTAALYAYGRPEAKALLDDMRALDSYHRRLEVIRQIRREYGASLLVAKDGEPDWSRTLAGLKQAEPLDRLLKVFPELRDVLLSPDRPDPGELKDDAEGLARSYHSFRASSESVSQLVNLCVAGNTEVEIDQCGVSDFVQRLAALGETLAEELGRAERLYALLATGRDVLLTDVPARLRSIAELLELRSRIARLAEGLGLAVDLGRGIEDRDWSALRSRCEWLIGSLDGRPDEMPSPLVWEVGVTEPRDFDAESLVRSSDELRQRYQEFQDLFDDLAQHFDLAGLLEDARSAQAEVTVADFVDRLASEETAIARELAIAERVCRLLNEGQDVRLAELPARVATIGALCPLHGRQIELARRAGVPVETGAALATTDWQAQGSLGGWVVGFLDRYADRPPQPLIRAATSPEFRAELGDAVRHNRALRTRQFDESWGFLASLFDTSGEVSTGLIIDRTPLAELANWAAQRAADAHLIEEWTRFRDLDERIARAGISPLLTEILDGQLTVDEAADAFQARFFRSWLDEVYARDPALRDFGTETHERLISQFRELDEESIRLGYTRIREELLGDRVAPEFALGDVPGSSELGVLMKEVQKKKRHLPLRKLFARIPGQLLRLKPCLMMSPLAVSTYLDSPALTFDLVVFDEASQVRPHDAICAIYRGRQLVVAGDQKQLPPTDFFTKSVDGDDLTSDDDAEEDGQSLADFESVLDVCCTLGMPRRRLRWHYRSRRESLIAFSNRHLYDNELVTFPSVHDTGDDRAVRLDFVAEGRWRSGSSGGYNVEEARRVAQQVLQHFREHPEQSLGVIAFSQRQQTAILDELERLRRTDPSLEEYFAESAEEPFFVKNLENVQGDERDAILLSVGYGRDESGRLAMRFGPINRLGGERRLNVAITRARVRMTVVSSIRAQDIDTARTSSDGPALLRAYLDYAERGVEALAAATTEDEGRDFDSPFEREVAAALARRGLEVRKQIGCGGYRIDLALVDPEQPGRYVLGVECDGATYHSSATARDRDRLRQQVLESLGWRICRIWSTDWVRNPARQVDRVVQAYEAARRELASPAPAVTGPDRATRSAEPSAEKVSRPRGPVARAIHPRYAGIDEVSEAVKNSTGVH